MTDENGPEILSARATGTRVVGCYDDGTPYEFHFMVDTQVYCWDCDQPLPPERVRRDRCATCCGEEAP